MWPWPIYQTKMLFFTFSSLQLEHTILTRSALAVLKASCHFAVIFLPLGVSLIWCFPILGPVKTFLVLFLTPHCAYKPFIVSFWSCRCCSLFCTILILTLWFSAVYALHLCKDLNICQSRRPLILKPQWKGLGMSLVALSSSIEIADPVCVGLRVRVTGSAKPSGSQRVVYTTAYSVVLSWQLTQYPHTAPWECLVFAPPNVLSQTRLFLPFMSRLCSLTGTPNHRQLQGQYCQGGVEC